MLSLSPKWQKAFGQHILPGNMDLLPTQYNAGVLLTEICVGVDVYLHFGEPLWSLCYGLSHVLCVIVSDFVDHLAGYALED